jgi:hypothetical protein
MNKIKTIILLLLVSVSGANAQIITLNYNDFSSNDCDVFGSPIPVQGILHETKRGDVTKNTSQNGIQLKFDYSSGSNNQKGSEFSIFGLTFKKDYKYVVKITAKNNNSYSEPAGLKCNFNPINNDPSCNGVNYINQNNGTFSSNNSNWFQTVNGTSFTEYTFESDYLSSAQTSLGIGTYSLFHIGSSSQNIQTIFIKKIEIFETPPPPSFSLTPSTLNLDCGDIGQKTFTVTPSNIPSGATVTYNWSYISNDWIFIDQTATSITLQPRSSTSLPSNVTVNPSINGVAQASKTCIVSRAPFNTNAILISGNSYVCDTGVYTINNLPSGVVIQSVASSNNSIATVSLTGTNQITVTKVSDGIVSISAIVQNTCNQTATISNENLQIGIPSNVYNTIISGSNYVCSNQSYTYTISDTNHPCITSYNWVVSPNLQVIYQDSNSITIVKNPFNNQNAGYISYIIPNTNVEIRKGVWVGLPEYMGLNIQKLSSYDLYPGSWTTLKATYNALIYPENGNYNLTYEWLIPSSLVRNYTDTAYKDVNPRNSGQINIGVRAWNECGCSDYKYKLFDVISTGGGGGSNIIIPAN